MANFRGEKIVSTQFVFGNTDNDLRAVLIFTKSSSLTVLPMDADSGLMLVVKEREKIVATDVDKTA